MNTRLLGYLYFIPLIALSACAGLDLSQLPVGDDDAVTQTKLTIGDVNPNLVPLESTPFDAVEREGITYYVTRDSDYDRFFKTAAVSYGGLAVANTMLREVNDALAILETQSGPLCDQTKLLRLSIPNLPIAGVTLEGSIRNAKKLVPQAASLAASAKTDFPNLTGSEVLAGLERSRDQLTKVKDDGPAVVARVMELTTRVNELVLDNAACA